MTISNTPEALHVSIFYSRASPPVSRHPEVQAHVSSHTTAHTHLFRHSLSHTHSLLHTPACTHSLTHTHTLPLPFFSLSSLLCLFYTHARTHTHTSVLRFNSELYCACRSSTATAALDASLPVRNARGDATLSASLRR